MKHLLCILACAFLVLSFSYIQQDKGQRKLAAEVSFSKINAEAQLSSSDSIASQQNSEDNSAWDICKKSNYHIGSGILSSDFSLNEVATSKVLRLRTHVAIRLLKSLVAPLPREGHHSLSYNNNYAQYSCEYYVYTLGHILI